MIRVYICISSARTFPFLNGISWWGRAEKISDGTTFKVKGSKKFGNWKIHFPLILTSGGRKYCSMQFVPKCACFYCRGSRLSVSCSWFRLVRLRQRGENIKFWTRWLKNSTALKRRKIMLMTCLIACDSFLMPFARCFARYDPHKERNGFKQWTEFNVSNNECK